MRNIQEITQRLLATGRWGQPMISIAERAGYRCEYCDLDLLASPESYKIWQCDHIIPKAAGGDESLDNLALACRHCNCDWKGQWNPCTSTEKHAGRDELIQSIRSYISNQRSRTESELNRVRGIVGYRDGRIVHETPLCVPSR